MEISREEFIQGKILFIDKDYEWTSFDAINKIRVILNKKLGIKKIKVGHAGTLDPNLHHSEGQLLHRSYQYHNRKCGFFGEREEFL